MKRFWVLIAAMVLALSILPIGVEVYAANSVEEILQEDETQKSYEQAVRALRQQLVERKEVCTVTLPDNFSVEASVLFDGALAHTGVGSEGDYLRSNLDLNIKALNMIVSGTYSFTVKYRTTWEQEQIVNDLVTQLAEEIRGESNADTLNNICRYINNHCAYDQYYLDMMEGPYYYWDHPSEFNSMKQTAYGALVNKTAVCEGLSALFYRLCMETGIDARIIYGKSGDMGHAWVIADVTGNRDYYHFDPTSSFYFMGGSISLEDGAYGELLYAPNGEYISEEFSSLYPMPDETYTFNIDYSFDSATGVLTINQNVLPDIILYLDEYGAALNGVVESFTWPDAVKNGTTTIVLPDGLTQIGDHMFKRFENLEHIEIPDTVTRIGKSAFQNCRNLKSVTLPAQLTSIGDKAFLSCINLTNISMPDRLISIGTEAFHSCWELTGDLTLPEGLTEIGDFAFRSTKLTSVLLPTTVTRIGNYAFDDCENLTQVNIPEGVTDIGAYAFYDTAITSVTIPSSVLKMGAYAFGNTPLENVKLEARLERIETGTFEYCSELKQIYLPDSVEEIGPNAFNYCKNLETIGIHEDIKRVGEKAFSNCVSLKNVNLGSSLTHLGMGAFNYCTSLTDVQLPDTLMQMGESAFANCTELTQIHFPGTLERIPAYGMNGCTKLQSVTVEYGTKEIAQGAFAGCSVLRTVKLPNSLDLIADDAFNSCSALTEVVFSGTEAEWEYLNIGGNNDKLLSAKRSYLGTDLPVLNQRTIILDPCGGTLAETEWTVSKDGALGVLPEPTLEGFHFLGWSTSKTDENFVTAETQVKNLGTDTLHAHWEWPAQSEEMIAEGSCGNSLTWVIYADGRMVIRGSGDMVSYEGNDQYPWYVHRLSVRYLELEEGVTSIGRAAFFGFLELESVSIPSSINVITQEAFALCQKLKHVILPTSVTRIEQYAFSMCDELNEITIPASVTGIGDHAFACTGIEKVTFSGGKVVVGRYAFCKCEQLKKVDLNGVTLLGDAAFAECFALEEIIVPGTVTRVGRDQFNNCGMLKRVVFEEGVSEISKSIFRDCVALESVILPDSVVVLPDALFCNLERLSTVEIGNRVCELSEMLFAGCKNLSQISLPATVTRIEIGALKNCSGLTDIYWAGTEDTWAKVSVEPGNEVLENVTHHWNKDYVSVYFDPGSGISDRYVKKVVEGESYGKLPTASYGECVFEGWYTDPVGGERIDENSTVYAQKTHTLYARWSGNYCSSEESDGFSWTISHDGVLTLRGTGTMPNMAAHWEAYKKIIKKVIVEDGLTSISERAFTWLENMEEIVIAKSVRLIEKNAFLQCNRLKRVYIQSPERMWDCVTVKLSNDIFLSADFYFEEEKNEVFISGAFNDSTLWELYDTGLLKIRGSGTMTDYDGYVIDGLDVSTAPWAVYTKAINNLVVENGVTSIGNYAFRGLTNISTVSLPEGLIRIGDNAFNKTGLVSVNLPESLKEIGDAAFQNTPLTSVTIPDSVAFLGDGLFGECTQLTQCVLPSNLRKMPQQIFVGCTGLTDVVIPEGVVSIGDNAFNGCEGLTELILPESLVTIRFDAFKGCSGLTELIIPENVTTIKPFAFAGCSGLSELIIPENVVTIGNNAFDGCTGLTDMVIPDSVETLDTAAFRDCSNLKTVKLSNQLKVISGTCFYGCTSLTRIDIPADVHTIKGRAFRDCIALTEIYFQGGAPTIDSSAFANVTATVKYPEADESWTEEVRQNYEGVLTWEGYTVEILTSGSCGENLNWNFDAETGTLSITGSGVMTEYNKQQIPWHPYRSQICNVEIAEGITSISGYAFADCDQLTILEIPEGVVSIGMAALQDCDRLANITLPSTLERLGRKVFAGCINLPAVNLPDALTVIPENAFRACNSLKEIVLPDELVRIGDYAFQYCGMLTQIDIPESVTQIGAYAFENCKNLLEIEIPNGVTEIREYTFGCCSNLLNVSIPESVVALGEYCFSECGKIQTLSLPNNVQTIGFGAFYYCVSLQQLELPDSLREIPYEMCRSCSGLTSVKIPESITKIGSSAFARCQSLASVELPKNLITVESLVFSNCKKLKSIDIPKMVTRIETRAFENCEALTKIRFMSKAPSIAYDAFLKVNSYAYYPSNDVTWNENTLKPYSGTITWIPVYEILEGDQIVVNTGENQPLEIRIPVEITEFKGVTIDDESVDPSNYTLTEGSTIFTFKPEYLKTLEEGEHTIEIHFTSGVAIAEVSVEKPAGILGDLDLNGLVNSDDLTLLARHVGGIELVSGQALLNADVNGDDLVNSDDLTKHARYVGGIITDWDQE